MKGPEQPEQSERLLENLALKTARKRTNVAKWDLNILIVLFSVLVLVIILVSLNTDTKIVAAIAAVGLVLVWLVGWRRGEKLLLDYYTEEISSMNKDITSEVPYVSDNLSSREKEILNFAARGYSNKLIANELGISVNTVKVYISRIMTKLDAKDRTEAVVTAIKQRQISLE